MLNTYVVSDINRNNNLHSVFTDISKENYRK